MTQKVGHSKAMRNFLKATSEKARLAKVGQILIKQLCHNCEYAKQEKIMLVRKIKVPDEDKRVCRNCIALMYRQCYGEELKNANAGLDDVSSNERNV